MLNPVTTKMTDESADGAYRFTFYCDICGKPHRSPAYQSMAGGEGDERERKAEYEDAYARANREILNKFSRCPVCQRVVCDECFDVYGDYDMCVECRQSGKHGDGDESGRRQAARLRRNSLYIVVAAFLLVAGAGVWAFGAAKDSAEHTDIADSRTPLGALANQADPGHAAKESAGLPQSKASAGLPQIDESAKPYTGAEPTMLTAEGVKIPDAKSVTISADTADARILLFNPADNPCYFVFELIINGESYYKSDLVEPSKCIEDLKLIKPLPKGAHTAILKISTYSLDESLSPMNGANVEFELIVM